MLGFGDNRMDKTDLRVAYGGDRQVHWKGCYRACIWWTALGTVLSLGFSPLQGHFSDFTTRILAGFPSLLNSIWHCWLPLPLNSFCPGCQVPHSPDFLSLATLFSTTDSFSSSLVSTCDLQRLNSRSSSHLTLFSPQNLTYARSFHQTQYK